MQIFQSAPISLWRNFANTPRELLLNVAFLQWQECFQICLIKQWPEGMCEANESWAGRKIADHRSKPVDCWLNTHFLYTEFNAARNVEREFLFSAVINFSIWSSDKYFAYNTDTFVMSAFFKSANTFWDYEARLRNIWKSINLDIANLSIKGVHRASGTGARVGKWF